MKLKGFLNERFGKAEKTCVVLMVLLAISIIGIAKILDVNLELRTALFEAEQYKAEQIIAEGEVDCDHGETNMIPAKKDRTKQALDDTSIAKDNMIDISFDYAGNHYEYDLEVVKEEYIALRNSTLKEYYDLDYEYERKYTCRSGVSLYRLYGTPYDTILIFSSEDDNNPIIIDERHYVIY